MKDIPRISEAEWKVMEVVWQKHPITADQIIKRLLETKWAANTIRTLLSRLTKKGVLAAARDGAAYLYRPLVERDKCVQEESDSFLNRVFGGSATPLLVHFAQKAKLSPAEVKELKAILERGQK